MYRKIIIPENKKQVHSNRKKRKDEMDFWINSTFSYLIGFITISFIYLIWSLNTWATQWYEIRDLEREKQDLLIQKETLEVKISDLESRRNIDKSDSRQKMEKIEDPDFIVIRNWVNYAFNK